MHIGIIGGGPAGYVGAIRAESWITEMVLPIAWALNRNPIQEE